MPILAGKLLWGSSDERFAVKAKSDQSHVIALTSRGSYGTSCWKNNMVPMTTSWFLELNLNGLAPPSLPSYHIRVPSMSSSTSESCCGHCRWVWAPSPATHLQQQCRKTSENLSCYRRDSVNPVLFKKQNQNNPELCSKQYLEWAEHTSGVSFTQAFIMVSSHNSLIFWKRVIAALRVEWTLIRHGPQCIRVKKHLMSGLWEAGGVGEMGCSAWKHTE